MISRIRHGSSPAFQNVCHWSRGLWTRSPGPASITSSPRSAPIRPVRTKLYSSSRVWRCSGAASARGDIGCSTSENRWPASAPSTMKRTPMLPRKPSWASFGPMILRAVVSMPASFRWTVVSRESVTEDRRVCQYLHATPMSDQKRTYRKTRRADLEEETRLRITESAVALHEELGPARTSISAVAERAGVRRSTVYRHFPDDEALFAACSSHFRAANPPPDPSAWATIEDPGERVQTALRELYAFYARTEGMYTSLLRDEALVPIIHRRLGDFYGYLRMIEDGLMAGRGLRGRAARRTRAALGHALAFPTWRSLAREQELGDGEAVALMSVLVEGAATAG